ncbi:MAG TPA: hypothetical protein VGG27_01215 [Magnetospirillaceae bacterium]|jgi:hypothetical protein
MSAEPAYIAPPRPVLTEIDRSRISSLNQILIQASFARRAEINEEILRVLGPIVAHGPFAGTKLPARSSWGEGEVTPKILGCYEEELHPAVEKAIARNPTRIVNVGCAEGYYANGLGRRLPSAQVLAFDIDPKAQAVCRTMADENGVGDRMTVDGECSPERLRAIAADGTRSLIVMDCEGAELDLLDAPTASALIRCDLIIECHDFASKGTTQKLIDRFKATHSIEVIEEGARNPGKYPELRGLNSIDRWLALCEFRPSHMNWLACWSR